MGTKSLEPEISQFVSRVPNTIRIKGLIRDYNLLGELVCGLGTIRKYTIFIN